MHNPSWQDEEEEARLEVLWLFLLFLAMMVIVPVWSVAGFIHGVASLNDKGERSKIPTGSMLAAFATRWQSLAPGETHDQLAARFSLAYAGAYHPRR